MFVSLAQICIVYVVKEVMPCTFTMHTYIYMYNMLSMGCKAIPMIVCEL